MTNKYINDSNWDIQQENYIYKKKVTKIKKLMKKVVEKKTQKIIFDCFKYD